MGPTMGPPTLVKLDCIIVWITSSFTGVAANSLAHNKQTYASTNGSGSSPARVVDGGFSTRWTDYTCWEAMGVDMNPYWMVDLDGSYYVHHVNVTNRSDCCAQRMHSLQILLYADNPIQNPGAISTLCAYFPGPVGSGVTQTIPCLDENASGRFLKIKGLNRKNGNDQLHFCEVTVSGSPAGSCSRDSYLGTESSRTTAYERLDTLLNAREVHTLPSLSVIHCGATCQLERDCCYFKYDGTTGQCHLHSFFYGAQVACSSHESCYASL